MDDPALDTDEHRRALRGLARLNFISRSAASVWPSVRAAASASPGRRLRVLDVATGAGDVPIALLRLARRHGVRLEVDACDVSDRALECARERAQIAGVSLRLFQQDAIRGAIEGRYDVVVSSLFLHHLPPVQAIALLQNMRQCSTRQVIVNDLRRQTAGLAAAWFASRLLTGSRVVRTDAVRSVRAAFTISEVQRLAEEAGMVGASVVPRWPWRFLLHWSQP